MAPASTPNVLLIVIDTLRADHIHGYGYPRETTPQLDRFIAEGVRFDVAIAPSSWSAPSHTTIITGTSPYHHSVFDWGQQIAAGVEPLAVHLKRRGYATGLFSSHRGLHRGVRGITHGSDHVVVLRNRQDAEVLDAALDWVRSVSQPYFLYVCLMTPHAPYDKYPADYDERYFQDQPPGGDRIYPFTETKWVGEGGIPASVRIGENRSVGYYVNRYDRSIRYVDALVGRFWQALERTGTVDDALLVVTSDHGEGLGDHETFAHELYLYDFLVRVPLIIHWPGVIPARQRWSRLVTLADIVPTLLGLTGAPIPDGLDGVDLSASLRRGEPPAKPRVAMGSYRSRGYDRYMVRSEGFKLLYDAVARKEEFYDLAADPTESEDLLSDRDGDFPADAYQGHRAQMLELLARHAAAPPGRASVPLTQDVIDELQALGYIEAPAAE
jgi:arylsulfatase A-like enzyme